MNLYQKLASISGGIDALAKDGTAPPQMGGFKFTSHGNVLAHLRQKLADNNVVIVPNGVEVVANEIVTTSSGKPSRYVVLKFEFVVTDGDNPEDHFIASWFGEGMDTHDKGIQKAGTSAEKYFLMKLFKVTDKDDPDAMATDPIGPQERAGAPNGTTTAPAPVEAKERVSRSVEHQPDDGNGDKEAKIKSLIWFGAQLPQTAMWFEGKIRPLIMLWEAQNKAGKLKPEWAEAGSSVNYLFNEIAKAHETYCGPDCVHLKAAEVAIIFDGTVKDVAEKPA